MPFGAAGDSHCFYTLQWNRLIRLKQWQQWTNKRATRWALLAIDDGSRQLGPAALGSRVSLQHFPCCCRRCCWQIEHIRPREFFRKEDLSALYSAQYSTAHKGSLKGPRKDKEERTHLARLDICRCRCRRTTHQASNNKKWRVKWARGIAVAAGLPVVQ